VRTSSVGCGNGKMSRPVHMLFVPEVSRAGPFCRSHSLSCTHLKLFLPTPWLPTTRQTLVQDSDVGPWTAFFSLCVRRQFKLLGRDMELLQGRLAQASGGASCLAGLVAGLGVGWAVSVCVLTPSAHQAVLPSMFPNSSSCAALCHAMPCHAVLCRSSWWASLWAHSSCRWAGLCRRCRCWEGWGLVLQLFLKGDHGGATGMLRGIREIARTGARVVPVFAFMASHAFPCFWFHPLGHKPLLHVHPLTGPPAMRGCTPCPQLDADITNGSKFLGIAFMSGGCCWGEVGAQCRYLLWCIRKNTLPMARACRLPRSTALTSSLPCPALPCPTRGCSGDACLPEPAAHGHRVCTQAVSRCHTWRMTAQRGTVSAAASAAAAAAMRLLPVLTAPRPLRTSGWIGQSGSPTPHWQLPIAHSPPAPSSLPDSRCCVHPPGHLPTCSPAPPGRLPAGCF